MRQVEGLAEVIADAIAQYWHAGCYTKGIPVAPDEQDYEIAVVIARALLADGWSKNVLTDEERARRIRERFKAKMNRSTITGKWVYRNGQVQEE